MLVVSISVAAVLAIGVTAYFAYKFKDERDTIQVKFNQAQSYADSTARHNTTLVAANRTLSSEVIVAKDRVAELTKQLEEFNNAKTAAKAANTIVSAPAMTAKKAGRGRPTKKNNA